MILLAGGLRKTGSAFGLILIVMSCLDLPSAIEAKSIFDDEPAAPTTAPAPAPPAPRVDPAPPPPGPDVKSPAVPPRAGVDSGASRVKMAPPDAVSQVRITKLVKQVFEAEYASRTPAAKRKLAGALTAEADKIQSNFDARYVLLQEALAAALAGGDVDGCRKSIAGLDSYKMDLAALTLEVLARLSSRGAAESPLAAWSVDLIQQRIKDDDYPGARKIIRLMASIISRSRDAVLAAKLKSAELVLAEYDKVHLAIETLKHEPADPAANLAAGKFYCFFKHEWDRGLPMLARGTDAKLKEVAARDLATPADAKARLALAGAWWDLGHDKAHVYIQTHLHERAGYWYLQAMPDLTGLEKTMAEKRSAEAPAGAEPALTQLSDNDIGKPALAGSFKYDAASGSIVLNGGGKDMWSDVDQLTFLNQRCAGDGSVIAKVTAQANTGDWARAGVMFRNDTEAGSYYAAALVTPAQGVVFQWGGGAAYSPKLEVATVSAPVWLKITRAGTEFSAYYSIDGQTWTPIGTPQQCPKITPNALVGLAVCGCNNVKTGSATFSNIVMPRGP